MARLRLDDRTVDRFPVAGGLTVLWDTELYGFGCRAGTHRDPEYFVCFRTPLSVRWTRRGLGSVRSLSCDQARRMAQEIIGRSAPQQLKRKAAPRET